MTLKDIQVVSMDIMSIIDEFCQCNNIHYSLGYGALIGAVRHKGCIPWDDDIDIIITRPEYQKLLKFFNEDKRVGRGGVKLYAPELGNCYFPIARICDIKRTKVHKYYQWTDEFTGVWIDVFIMDGLPEDGGKEIKSIIRQCYNSCLGKVHFSRDISLSNNVKMLKRKFLYFSKSRNLHIINYLNEISKCNWDNSSMVCNLCSPYNKDIHRKDIFNNYIKVPFEDREFSILAFYDEYLQNIYGNYMQLPSIEKQVRGHEANSYMWI